LKENVIQLFEQYPQAAIVLSLVLSILIAIAGLIPSVFITAANILFFGFWPGTLISFMGEALGATTSFFLYRKGFKKTVQNKLHRFPRLQTLIAAEGKQAFLLVVSFRLIPFIPSGLVTFAAAIGRVSAAVFVIASSIGKIPALVLEAYSVFQVTRFGWEGKVILSVTALLLLYFTLKQVLPGRKNQ
jgi:uncharacterized membrane protein YdjX (TVP38/TMEM64 family)